VFLAGNCPLSLVTLDRGAPDYTVNIVAFGRTLYGFSNKIIILNTFETAYEVVIRKVFRTKHNNQ
jgi:hypothetical protein